MQQAMPYDDRDEETGKFNPEFADSDFIEALEAIEHEASTREVMEEVGCARRTAYERLVQLEEEGEIKSRMPGRVKLWSVADDEE